jgi:hypothetical protein
MAEQEYQAERLFIDSADNRDEAWRIADDLTEAMHQFKITGNLISVRRVRPNFYVVELVHWIPKPRGASEL